MGKLTVNVLFILMILSVGPAAEATSDPASVLIKDILFTGNTVITTETLREATKDFKNQELTIDDMNSVVDLVTMTYQEKGYVLARAYLPEQEIKSGYLIVAVVEGSIEKIDIDGDSYYNDRVIKRYFERQLKHGVVNEEFLERALLLTKDMPEADTRVVLKSGEKPGTVNVVLPSEKKFAINWGFDYNNFGSDLVGKDRYGAHLDITDPWWGCTLSLRAVTGNNKDDSGLGSAELSVPVNNYGTRVSLKYLKGQYGVGQDLADLGLEGETRIFGTKISHPVLRTRNMNLNAGGGFDRKKTENYINYRDRLSVDRLRVYNVGFDFDNVDRFLGRNIVSARFFRGNISHKANTSVSRRHADNHFDRVTVNMARIQRIYGYMNFMLRASVQLTDDRLLPIEQMVIGGYGTVRGHRTSMYLGDKGYNYSGEFMTAPPFIAEKNFFGQTVAQSIQLAAFYDHGRVFTNYTEPGEYDDARISGYGAGIRLFYKNLILKYDIGLPTSRTPEEKRRRAYHYVMCAMDF